MTIELLHVNLNGCFAPGQAYVACSRGRSAETMVVENFSEKGILTSGLVKEFYASLKDETKNFNPPTWAVILEDSQKEPEIMTRLTARYGGDACQNCQSECTVYKVKNHGENKGKWVVQCKANYDSFCKTRTSERGHTFRYVPAPPMV